MRQELLVLGVLVPMACDGTVQTAPLPHATTDEDMGASVAEPPGAGGYVPITIDRNDEEVANGGMPGTGGGIGVVGGVPLFQSSVSGLCSDGTFLYAVNSETFEIVQYRWPLVERIRSYDLPSNIGPAVLGDCAVLDQVLYYADVGKSTIGTVNLASGEVDAYHLPAPAGQPRSVAADATSLWVSCDAGPVLIHVSPTGEILSRWVDTWGNGCEGLEIDSSDLYCTDTLGGTLTRIAAANGTVLEGPSTVDQWEGTLILDGVLWAGFNGNTWTPTGLDRRNDISYVISLVPILKGIGDP